MSPSEAADNGAGRWFAETLHTGLELRFQAKRVLAEEKTAEQHLVLIETEDYGTVLILDGAVQVCTADEFIYHEMMAHPALLALEDPKRVLIIGGGDGGLAEEVLKHPSIDRLTQVEIDASVVDFARTHFADLNKGCFDDPRMDVVIADGAAFMAKGDDVFDAIFIDSTDPIGPGRVLFEEAFYRACARRLAPNGVMVSQNSAPFLQKDAFQLGFGGLKRAFVHTAPFVIAVPTYFGGHMTLGWSSHGVEGRDSPQDALLQRLTERGLDLRYYTPSVHHGAFALPGYIQTLFDSA